MIPLDAVAGAGVVLLAIAVAAGRGSRRRGGLPQSAVAPVLIAERRAAMPQQRVRVTHIASDVETSIPTSVLNASLPPLPRSHPLAARAALPPFEPTNPLVPLPHL